MFTKEYAELYDLFHAKKDYQNEVNQIIEVLNFDEICGLNGFDFGCGTGVHALEFFKRGVKVDGYDISQDMLAVAENKYPNLKFSNNLSDFNENYDFTYSLFDVISYQVTFEAALNLIKNLFSRTKPGGFCLVDSWNSQGVRVNPPEVNERTVTSSLGEIVRRVLPDLNQSGVDMYRLKIDLLERKTHDVLKSETHILRAWSPEEVWEIMSSVGFVDLTLYNPANPRLKFEATDWRFGIKARKL
jgi:SAM-dependent methyltransferase